MTTGAGRRRPQQPRRPAGVRARPAGMAALDLLAAPQRAGRRRLDRGARAVTARARRAALAAHRTARHRLARHRARGGARRCWPTCRRCGSSSGSSPSTSPPGGPCSASSGRPPARCSRWPAARPRRAGPRHRRCAGGGFVRAMAWPGDASYDLVVPRDAAGRRPRRAARRRRRSRPGCGPSRRCGSRAAGRGSASTPITARSPTRSAGSARAVHLDKGCYRGQETVARVQNLGKPPRRLTLVHLAGESDELPEPGTADRGQRPHGRLPRHGRAPPRARSGRPGRDQADAARRHGPVDRRRQRARRRRHGLIPQQAASRAGPAGPRQPAVAAGGVLGAEARTRCRA